jgi:hypothetical protein
MLEKGTSGLMSGEGKRAAASRPRTAPFLDSTVMRSVVLGAARKTLAEARARENDQRGGGIPAHCILGRCRRSRSNSFVTRS